MVFKIKEVNRAPADTDHALVPLVFERGSPLVVGTVGVVVEQVVGMKEKVMPSSFREPYLQPFHFS